MSFLRRDPGPRLRLGHATGVLLPRPVVLEASDVHTHKHVIGTTGVGKSKFLASLFVQLYGQGVAAALIDPHSDLALDVLSQLYDRGAFPGGQPVGRLLYVDFARRDAFLPFNVLKQPYPPHDVARHLVEVCTRAWPALGSGAAPQFENILLAAALTLIQNGRSLTDLHRLLTDKAFRDGLLPGVTDPMVSAFWTTRFDRWGRETPHMVESTLRRAFLLTFVPTLRHSLGQPENRLDFRQLMDSQTSVVFNLGGLDEETQRFLGCLITVGFEVAALSRADTPEEHRTPYHLIMDEFFQFSAQSEEALARVLSLARKYRLFLTLAHQTWSQLSSRLAGSLQNTVSIAFRLGRSDAEWAAPRFGRFEEHAVKHVVANEQAEERTHPVYWSIPETFERWAQALEDLPPRHAFVKVGRTTTRLRTLPVPPPRVTRQELRGLTERYCRHLLTPLSELTPGDGAAPPRPLPHPRPGRARVA